MLSQILSTQIELQWERTAENMGFSLDIEFLHDCVQEVYLAAYSDIMKIISGLKAGDRYLESLILQKYAQLGFRDKVEEIINKRIFDLIY